MKRHNEAIIGSFDLANCLMLLSQQIKAPQESYSPEEFECKTCNRKFSSFQALGGHRAGHKRQKLDGDQLHGQAKSLTLSLPNNKPKMHECSICGLEFSLGQALGGHMRRHRAANDQAFQSVNQLVAKSPVLRRSNSTRALCLDLNLTPFENDLKLLFGNMAPKIEAFV